MSMKPKFVAKSVIADSCLGLIGPRLCSTALGRPATLLLLHLSGVAHIWPWGN